MKLAAGRTLALAACVLAATPPAVGHAAATFTDIGAGLTGMFKASIAWGDYDNDGDLDIAVIGLNTTGNVAKIYRNTAGVFAATAALPADAALANGQLAWGDYDRDGDLDLAVTGAAVTTFTPTARIYRNTAGTFADIGAGLQGVTDAAVSWADFDNDGDLDVTLAGVGSGSTQVARLYRNTAGVFTDAVAGLTPVRFASMAWSDYDKDGDQDLVLAGAPQAGDDVTTLYRNTGGVLAAVVSGLPALRDGCFDWGDFDKDGDPDLLLGGSYITQAWRNTAGSFANTGFVFEGLSYSSAVWGDYDNDGNLDVAESGATGSIGYGAVYHNNVANFTDISAPVPDLFNGAMAWGDYDNDGDLDLMAAGPDDQGVYIECHRIFRVDGVAANNLPTAPTNLSVTTDATTITFHWLAGTDAQGSAGLSYNLWAGTAPGTPNVMSPMSNLANGYRRVAQEGNAGQGLQWKLLKSAFSGNVAYWGVQAVDQAYAGSLFATGPSTVLGVDEVVTASRPTLRLAGAQPTRSDARLAFTLPHDANVDLAILDVTGRRVQTLVRGERGAGDHEAVWNGEAASGSHAGPGLYFARLAAGGDLVSMRVVRIE